MEFEMVTIYKPRLLNFEPMGSYLMTKTSFRFKFNLTSKLLKGEIHINIGRTFLIQIMLIFRIY